MHVNHLSKSLITSTAVLSVSTDEPVTIDQIRQACRVVADDEDDLLRSWAVTARSLVESDSHVALVRKTVRVRLVCFLREIRLPISPLISIESVSYIDVNGETQTIEPDDAWMMDNDRSPGALVFLPDYEFPETMFGRNDAVTIEYTVGHDPADKPAPEAAVSAILMLVAHWYKNREAVVVGAVSNEIELGYERLVKSMLMEKYP
jgi:uncharacterized phiE125 gp8 family phage protein